MTLPQPVYAAAYSDDDDIHIRVFKTWDGALRWRQEIARDYWDCHFTEPLPTDKTDQEIADHYFEWAPEYFRIREIMEIEP